MASYSEVVQRWIDRETGRDERPNLRNARMHTYDGTLYSYGAHFPLVESVRDKRGKLIAFLCNGDRYSVTTSRHPSIAQEAAQASGVPALTLPFEALRRAGIARDTVRPIDVRPDRIERWTEPVPGDWTLTPYGARKEKPAHTETVSAQGVSQDETGAYVVERSRHWLGDSIFSAVARGRRRWFISSFDYQERRPLYFLAELPREAKPGTVAEAIEALAPRIVHAAMAQGREVTRQGDIFAIPTELDTRSIRKRARSITKHGNLHGTNHVATEVARCANGVTYARGLLYHVPEAWRAPDHARRKMQDGKTWHLIVRNTVPRLSRRAARA